MLAFFNQNITTKINSTFFFLYSSPHNLLFFEHAVRPSIYLLIHIQTVLLCKLNSRVYSLGN